MCYFPYGLWGTIVASLVEKLMDFLFHTVYDEDEHSRYFNIYKIDDTHFLAQCHHFNRERDCEGDVEIVKENGEWRPNDPKFGSIAKQIGEEIERMEPHTSVEDETPRGANKQ